MAVVEDGEILEAEDNDVVNLTPAAHPSLQPDERSPTLLYRPQPSRPINTARPNPYTGGDPFQRTSKARNTHDRSPAFSQWHSSTPSLPHDHQVLAPVNASLPSSRPSGSPRDSYFERDPYRTDADPASVIRASTPKSLQARTHSPFVPTPNVSRASTLSAPLITGLPHSHSWPPHPPQDSSYPPFQQPFKPQIRPSQGYPPTHSTYSPNDSLRRFPDSPYAAAPSYYYEQLPSPPPINPDFERKLSEQPYAQRPYDIRLSPSTPQVTYDPKAYAQRITTEKVHPVNEALGPSDVFANVTHVQQGVPEINPAQHGRQTTEFQEEHGLRRGGPDRSDDVNGRHRDISCFDPRNTLDPLENKFRNVAVTEHIEVDSEHENREGVTTDPEFMTLAATGMQTFKYADTRIRYGAQKDKTYSLKDDESKMRELSANNGMSVLIPRETKDEFSEGEIDSPQTGSPITSLAAPIELPDPTSEKKCRNLDAKKHLSELRRKALLSIKKRSVTQKSDVSVLPPSPRDNRSPAALDSKVLNDEEKGQEVKALQTETQQDAKFAPYGSSSHCQTSGKIQESPSGVRIQAETLVTVFVGGVKKTMTRSQHADWQEWPYRNPILVDFSSDSDDASDDETNGGSSITTSRTSPDHQRRDRERVIEALKIRMVRLGKCPSILLKGSQRFPSENFLPAIEAVEPTAIEETNDGTSTDKLANETNYTNMQDNSDASGMSLEQEKGEPGHAPQTEEAKVSKIKIPDASEMTEGVAVNTMTSNELNLTSLPRQKEAELSLPRASSLGLCKTIAQEAHRIDKAAKDGSSHENLTTTQRTTEGNGNIRNNQAALLKRSPSAGSMTENRITALKRRIEAIEKSRELPKQHRRKKQKTVAVQGTELNETITTGFDLLKPRREKNKKPSYSRELRTPKAREPNDSGVRAVAQTPKGGSSRREKRYYSSGKPSRVERKHSALCTRDDSNDENALSAQLESEDVEQHESKSQLKEQGTIRLPVDNAEQSYIDDLKLELEQKTKELKDELDRAEQLRTAELAIAEAEAKLNFTRTRVSSLQEELRKAEQEAHAAEQELHQRVRVVSQMRFGHEESLRNVVSCGENTGVDLTSTQDPGGSVLYTDPDSTTNTDLEEEKKQDEEEMADLVLKPSPYSPSVGDNFTSCLRGLRAYVLRIPNHSKARDRIAGGILSSTWGTELDPMKAICPQELRGQCSRKGCTFQHLKVFKSPKDRALRAVQMIQEFFPRGDVKKEKIIVNARIAIHEGKDATRTLYSLISVLRAFSTAVPYYSATDS